MNHYTELLSHIKQLAESDGYVNTVTQGDIEETFLNKADIYPLLHISIDSGQFTNGQTLLFNVQLVCVALRDTNNEVRTDKFWEQDNEVDNLNETLGFLNKLWTKLYKDYDDVNIVALENPTLDKIEGEKNNVVDGWMITFDIETPNENLNLCT